MVFEERKIRLAAARKAVADTYRERRDAGVDELPAAILAFASVLLYGIEALLGGTE